MMEALVQQAQQICQQLDEQSKTYEDLVVQVEFTVAQEANLYQASYKSCQKKNQDVRSVLDQLCREAKGLQQKLNDDTTEQSQQHQFQQLNSEQDGTQRSIKNMEQQITQLQQQIESRQDDLQNLRFDKHKLQVSGNRTAQDLSSIESLLYHISNIECDFEATGQGICKGKIFIPNSQKPIRRYEFNEKETSWFEICNKLWELIV